MTSKLTMYYVTIMINLISWNLNSISTKLPFLQLLINDTSPAALCLQETKLHPQQKYHLKNYTLYRRDAVPVINVRGGVAVAVHNQLLSKEIQLNTMYQAVAARIDFPVPVTVCSIYLHQTDDVSTQQLSALADQLPQPFIITGDFNAYNTIWGDAKINPRGRELEHFIDTNQLLLLNTGIPTHFNSFTGNSSAIDLTICSPAIGHILDWHISASLYSSDHYPQIIELKLTPTMKQSSYPRWEIEKANWQHFQHELDLTDATKHTNVDDINSSIETSIIRAAVKSIPRTTTTYHKKRSVPWWNEECSTAIKYKNFCLSQFKRHPTTENLISFKRARAKARQTIITSKRNSWRAYISSINSTTTPTEVWKKVQILKNTQNYEPIHKITDANGNRLTSPEEISEAFANHLYDVTKWDHTTKIPDIQDISTFTPEDENTLQTSYNRQIDQHEVRQAIRSMRKTAPGPDSVHSEMLKHLQPQHIDAIVYLFQTIWNTHQLPTSWKEAHIIPIRKPGKTATELTSYRPISLTNTLCKTMEKIIVRRILRKLETDKSIDKHQSGFRPHKSTIDNLLRLQQEIVDGYSTNQFTVCIFFDVEKAFDRILPSTILKAAQQLQIRGNALHFIQSFLTNRTFNVRIGKHISASRKQETGTPQGSVISPLLFIAAINDLASNIDANIHYSMFADDLAIYTRGTNLQNIENRLQRCVTKLESWARERGLRFSSQKTNLINFTRKRKNLRPINIVLNNIPIPNVTSIKFLGLVFDHHLTWTKHIEYLKQKCIPRINLLKTLSRQKWGADRKTMLHLYSSLIKTVLDYGCVTFSNASKKSLAKLNTIQNTALRICIGAHCTSPVMSLHVEADVLPLQHHWNYRSLVYYTNLAVQPENVNHYKTFFSSIQYRRTLPFGERCRKLIQQYDVHMPTPLTTTNKNMQVHIYAAMKNSFQKEWTEGKPNKLRGIKPTIGHWSTALLGNRKTETALARLRIGHTNITHNALLDKTNPTLPTCTNCPTETLTVKHILNDCPKYSKERRQIYGNHPFPVTNTLQDCMHSVSKIERFLVTTNLLDQI